MQEKDGEETIYWGLEDGGNFKKGGCKMEGTVALILNKLEELIVAVGGKIEVFYPYVVKQVIIEGVLQLVGLLVSIGMLVLGLYLGSKNEWSDSNSISMMGFLLSIIGGIGAVVLFTFLWAGGLLQLINPHYYAVQRILEIGQGLLK